MSPASFSDILLGGLAPDGGLVIPAHYPRFTVDQLKSWQDLDYQGIALEILSRFMTDLPVADLQGLIRKSYNADIFGDPEVTPVKQLQQDLYLLRLSNGPTLAFKDIALQLLGNLFEYVLQREDQVLNILGATSGDTGSSAEYAVLGKHRIKIFMLSPHDGMSAFQSAQMYSLDEPNIFNIAVRGVFDDCQDIVKAVGEDLDFKRRHRIGAVNSINWARIAAQVVYYVKGYLRVCKEPGAPVSFAVPSGNFGNVFAGHVARQMGLPIRHLIVATNENDVLDEFFRTGHYGPRCADQVWRTSSPSMDISKASNFERFVYDLVAGDPAELRALWEQLAQRGSFQIDDPERLDRIRKFGFRSGTSNHFDRVETIRWAHQHCAVIVDPHTADGIKVGLQQREPGVPLICLETALPAKFEHTIVEALGTAPPRPAGFENIESRPRHVQVIDPDVRAVKDFIEQHT